MTENDHPTAWTNHILVLSVVHGPSGDDKFLSPPKTTPFFLWMRGNLFREIFRKSWKEGCFPEMFEFRVRKYDPCFFPMTQRCETSYTGSRKHQSWLWKVVGGRKPSKSFIYRCWWYSHQEHGRTGIKQSYSKSRSAPVRWSRPSSNRTKFGGRTLYRWKVEATAAAAAVDLRVYVRRGARFECIQHPNWKWCTGGNLCMWLT